MKRILVAVLAVTFALSAQSKQGRKVFIDQDMRGPAGSDAQSVLILLQSPQVEVLGITVTSGDGWAKAGTREMLRMVELTGHGNVPVAQGAEFPLINSEEETKAWEAQYGALNYKGAWSAENYFPSGAIPPLEAGNPTTKLWPRHGALLLIDTLHKFPGEVAVWVAGPFTTLALATRLDPEVPKLAKELVVMGSGVYGSQGGAHETNARREFNWWFDPEATRIVMSSPWKKITVTTVDISLKTRQTNEMMDEIAKSNSPTAKYLVKYSKRLKDTDYTPYMWDEIAAAAWIDPSLITSQREMQMNVDIDHGASYGQTIFLEKNVKAPSWLWRTATVQFDLDTKRFYQMFIDLMKR